MNRLGAPHFRAASSGAKSVPGVLVIDGGRVHCTSSNEEHSSFVATPPVPEDGGA